jgi:hypothetical protein
VVALGWHVTWTRVSVLLWWLGSCRLMRVLHGSASKLAHPAEHPEIRACACIPAERLFILWVRCRAACSAVQDMVILFYRHFCMFQQCS